MLKRRPDGGGAVLLGGEHSTLTQNYRGLQRVARGWNWLSLGGRGEAAPIDRRAVRPAQLAPAPRRLPKPVRAVLSSNPAMMRKLAEHQLAPWWLR